MNRRAILIGGVGVVAGAAGIGAAWWREQVRRADQEAAAAPAGTSAATLAAVSAAALSEMWSLRFEQPDGAELVLANFKGQPLLLNFWATWCPPCVTEMPLLDRFQAQHKARGWQVVGLAVDSPTPVREFLARQPMGFAIGLAGLNGIELARSLGNSSGALPFSVVFDRQGKVFRTKLGSLHEKDLADWAGALA